MEKHIPILISGLAVLFTVGLVFFSGKKRASRAGGEASLGKVGSMPGDPGPFIRMAPYYHVSLIVAVAVFLGVLVFFPVSATLRSMVDSGEGPGALARIFGFGLFLFLAFLFSLLKNNLD